MNLNIETKSVRTRERVNNMNAEQQYLQLGERLLSEGTWIENKRTGKKCLTIINADLEYDVGAGEFPILTTKQTFWKSAIAEMQGYLLGYRHANLFRWLGTKTWDANANKTKAWLENPNRQGEDDMGLVYGAVAKDFNGVNLIDKVIDNLRNGIDDRGEIITFWNPAVFDKGCLRPCMYSHHFSILDGTLYMNSAQRSVDVPLGLPFNMIQCYFLLALMARLTGLKAGKVYHKLVNVHIYEDQIEPFKEQLSRTPLDINPTFNIPDSVRCFNDISQLKLSDVCTLDGYDHLGKINFPFSE